jgi:hypothetical protein
MKNLLPNLSKIPPRVSIAMIALSLLIGYVSTLHAAMPPAHEYVFALDLGEWMRDSVNDQYRKLTSPDKPAQQIQQQVEEWQRSQCPPVPTSQVESTLPSGRLVEVGNDAPKTRRLSDPIAIALFNIAPGNTGRSVLRRVGLPNTSSQRAMSDYYNTADGRIAVKYERINNVSRVVSVGFVQ